MALSRRIWQFTSYVLLAVVVICALDWAFFRLRVARGSGYDTVSVEQYLVVPLKGSKEEYNYVGNTTVSCTRSLLPQYADSQWTAPCWWRERHRTIWVKASLAPHPKNVTPPAS